MPQFSICGRIYFQSPGSLTIFYLKLIFCVARKVDISVNVLYLLLSNWEVFEWYYEKEKKKVKGRVVH